VLSVQLTRVNRKDPHGRTVPRTVYNSIGSYRGRTTRDDERVTVTKKALAALGIGMIATGAALMIAFGVARSATSSSGGPR
jgi:hypothetical protein